MKVTICRINYKPGQTYTLKPIYDVHAGASAFDKKGFKKFLADSDENTFFIGGGDLFDAIVVTDKRYKKSSDGVRGDDILDQPVNEMVELLEPYRDRIIGLGVGNHEETVLKKCGTNLVKRTVNRLNDKGAYIKYLGKSGIIVLRFSYNGGKGRTLKIRYHHGWGSGGRTEGGSLTKYAKDVKYYNCDIALYGHDHKTMIYPIQRLDVVGDKLIAKPIHIGLCGTFLKTFLVGDDSTYSEDHGFPPVSVGGIKFTLKPTSPWIEIKGYTN